MFGEKRMVQSIMHCICDIKTGTGRQQRRYIVPKLYIQSKIVPEDGRVCRPKHVEQIQIDQ